LASSRADCFLFFDDTDKQTVGAVDGAVILVDGDCRLDEPETDEDDGGPVATDSTVEIEGEVDNKDD
jgi:hypothetical protein